VQWNAWVKWHGGRQMAYAGVNLEGMVYDGWPIARFIERELGWRASLDAAMGNLRPMHGMVTGQARP
jgi:hypothetical protein